MKKRNNAKHGHHKKAKSKPKASKASLGTGNKDILKSEAKDAVQDNAVQNAAISDNAIGNVVQDNTIFSNAPASAIVSNTSPEVYFRVIDGSEIKNLLELAHSIEKMSDDSFYYHVNENKNDFSSWVKDVFNQEELANEISKKNGRLETQAAILKFLVGKLVP